jgi:CBS domain-containing protein
LCITDNEGTCVGMVTRHDLVESSIKKRLDEENSPLYSPAFSDFASPAARPVNSHTAFRRRIIPRNNSSGSSLYRFRGFPAAQLPPPTNGYE